LTLEYPKLSLCMIVKDEEAFLEQCISSVKEIIDEIVVVDTGSKDKTVEVAKGLGAKVFHRAWDDDFSSARNFSLSKATGDWIFILDADETIAKKDLKKLKELTRTKEYVAYLFIQRNYMSDSKVMKWISSKGDAYEESKGIAGWLPASIVRLFRRDRRILFKGKVHETVAHSIKSFNGRAARTDIPIHHFGKLGSKEILRKKGGLYLKLGKKKIDDSRGKDAKSYYELSVQYQELGEFEKAEEVMKKAIELDPKWVQAYVNLGGNYLQRGMLQEAFDILNKAYKIDRAYPDTYNNLGIYFAKKGRYRESIIMLKKAIGLNPRYASAYKNLGVTYDKVGMHKSARQALEKAVELNPEYRAGIKLDKKADNKDRKPDKKKKEKQK